jgi:hypothetical protein
MSAQIANISLYIPHVFPNFKKEDIIAIIEEQSIGKVSHVDMVTKMGQDGKQYNAVYVHFEFWCDTIANRNFQARVCDPNQEARVVYDGPWYWIVLENKARKYTPGERKPRIDLSDFNTTKTQKATSWAAIVEPKPVSFKPVPALKPVATLKPKHVPSIAAPKPVVLQVEEEPICPKLALEDLMTDAEMSALIDEFVSYDDEAEFNKLVEDIEIEREMDECEAAMEEDDKHLTSVDVRYIQTLEQENAYYLEQLSNVNVRIMELNNSLYNEQIKSNALAEAIRLVAQTK